MISRTVNFIPSYLRGTNCFPRTFLWPRKVNSLRSGWRCLNLLTQMACSRFEYVKNYERDDSILPNVWIVIRIDGKGFHKFSKLHDFQKPNDANGKLWKWISFLIARLLFKVVF